MRAFKAAIAIVLLLLAILIVSGLYMTLAKFFRPAEEEVTPVPVEVVTAEVRPFYERFSYTGTVRGERAATLVARVASTIKELRVDVGDLVKAGQVLAVMDKAIYAEQARMAAASYEMAKLNLASASSARPEQIAQAEANLKAAQLAAETAYRNYQRQKNLFDEGVISRSQYEAAELQYESAKAQYTAAKENLRIARTGARAEDKESLQLAVEAAAAQLDLASTNLGFTEITAPYDGVISAVMADVGDFIGLGKPVFALVGSGGLKAEIYASADKIRLFEVGQTAQVMAGASREPIEARISLVSSTADQRSRLFLVELELPPDAPLLPNDFVDVKIGWQIGAGTVVLPAKAVLAPASDEPYIFTVEDGKAHRTPVKLGLRNGTCVQILEPLRGGETVIVSGQSYVAEGTTVSALDVPDSCAVPVQGTNSDTEAK